MNSIDKSLESYMTAASFKAESVESPNAWVGHLPFASWIIQQVKPKIFVELGTHTGNSYFAFCQTVDKHALTASCYAVDTWAGDEHAGHYSDDVYTRVDNHNCEKYAHFSKLMRMTFDEALTYFADESIDLLHIDGLHTYEAVKHDFESWLPKLAPGAVVLFHDTQVRERNFGVWKLWQELKEEFPANLEFLHSHGLGILQLNNAVAHQKIGCLGWSLSEQQMLIRYFAALGDRHILIHDFNGITEALADRDGQLATLNQTVADRDGQLATLNEAVADRDGQLATLNEAVADRDGQLATLNEAVADRDGQLATLNQAVADRDDQLATLNQAVEERDGQIVNFKEQIMSLNQLVATVKKWQQLSRLKKVVKTLNLVPQQPQEIHLLRKLERSIRKKRIEGYEWIRFNKTWYLKKYPDVGQAGVDPWQHYLEFGKKEGRALNSQEYNSGNNLNILECLQIALKSPGQVLKLSRIKRQIKKGNHVHVPFKIRLLWSTGARSFWKRNLRMYEIGKTFKQYSKQFSRKIEIETKTAKEILNEKQNKFFDLSTDGGPLISWDEGAQATKAIAGLPSNKQWDSISKKCNGNPTIDIVIPVYGQKNETLSCIQSVLNSACLTEFEIVVIDDGRKDEGLSQYLAKLEQEGLITLVTNSSNLGFVKSVNIGMALHNERDVVLLNSDTMVYSDWLDRIMLHASDASVATITPLSNSATICSYPTFCRDYDYNYDIPDEEIDRLASTIELDSVEVPTGVGFCMFVRRECLEDIGYFDADTFGRGYGEENDFCQRALQQGWKNIAIGNVFVRHYGGSSFGAEKADLCKSAMISINEIHPNYARDIENFINRDPMAGIREALDLRRLGYYLKTQYKRAILITLDMGGGTDQNVNNLAADLRREKIYPIILKCREGKLCFDKSLLSIFPNLKSIDLVAEHRWFQDTLRILSIDFVHVHHLLGLKQGTIGTLKKCFEFERVPYYVTIHDYFPICPRINLIDGSGKYCGEPEVNICDKCVINSGANVEINSVAGWRATWQEFLVGARGVFVPNSDVSVRLAKYFKNINLLVRPHDFQAVKSKRTLKKTISKIAIIGAIGAHKGSSILFSLASLALKNNSKIKFIVMGYTDIDHKFKKLKNVYITGAYDSNDAVKILKKLDCDAALFISTCPETFSYTLSQALQAGIFPIGFDLGAQGQRIREIGVGELLEPSLMTKTSDILSRIENINSISVYSVHNYTGYNSYQNYYGVIS